MSKIYIAAPMDQYKAARLTASNLKDCGHTITSTWHDLVGNDTVEPSTRGDRQKILIQCMAEVDEADGVYFLSGYGTPRCALVEVGYALAKGKRVAFSTPHNIADSHPNAKIYVSYKGIEEWLIPLDVGKKYDSDKLRFDLVPWTALEAIIRVLMHGAKKYGDENWKKVTPFGSRYLSAAFRHLVAYARGEENDQESGESHLAHIGCCILFLLEGPTP